MSLTAPVLVDQLNNGELQSYAEIIQELHYGDLLALLVRSLPATEAAAAVAANAKVLANAASVLLDVNVTAGGVTGPITKILKAAQPDFATIPLLTHQCVWDGATNVRFASADAVTAADFRYLLQASPVAIGYLARSQGERDHT